MNLRSLRCSISGLLLFCSISLAASASDETRTAYVVQPLLAEIRARQAQLDRRERNISERERTHAELLAIVAAQLEEIEDLQAVVETRIGEWEQAGGTRISKLAKIYAAMPAPAAARLIDDLDPALATQLLSKMKPKSSAAILEQISPSLALTVSEQVAHPLSSSPAKLDE